MKINVLQKRLDETKLNEEIQKFEILNNQAAYLFMNEETIDELASVCTPQIYLESTEGINGMICYYHGRRVYKNENLKLGEVEIR